jgi:hypothetical protein
MCPRGQRHLLDEAWLHVETGRTVLALQGWRYTAAKANKGTVLFQLLAAPWVDALP